MNRHQANHQADLVLKNAKVWTVDERLPYAEAVAVRGNEIVAVGRDVDMDSLIGSRTEIVDLNGQLVLPGFNDAHTHFISAILRAAGAFNLYGVTTVAEVRSRLREYAERYPTAEWLLGWRWDPSRFGSGGWPSRTDLDAVEDRQPVAIFDIDGHSCWVNTRALEALGYTADSPDPEGGQILRDSKGQPTGILLEKACDHIPCNPTLSPDAFVTLLRHEAAELNRLGITSLSNNGVQPEHFEAYAQMADEGRLTVRINEWLFLEGGLPEAQRLRQRFESDDKIRVVGLKVLLDGVLSTHTAWMLEPYADAPEVTGFPVVAPEALAEQVIEADAHGFQVLIHAIGDRAVRETLDIFERAAQVNGRRDSRHRIEHVEVVHPNDQKRFAELGVIASMTPVHCTGCIDAYIKDRLGESRGSHAYIWRNLVDMGVHLCFGTDWPAVDLAEPDPLKQIFAAVTRTTPQEYGRPVWHPEQRLSVAEAIRSYTLESAYAEFMEHRKGSITPGKLADLCVLSDNVLEPPPARILETEVKMTIFDGEVVYVSE